MSKENITINYCVDRDIGNEIIESLVYDFNDEIVNIKSFNKVYLRSKKAVSWKLDLEGLNCYNVNNSIYSTKSKLPQIQYKKFEDAVRNIYYSFVQDRFQFNNNTRLISNVILLLSRLAEREICKNLNIEELLKQTDKLDIESIYFHGMYQKIKKVASVEKYIEMITKKYWCYEYEINDIIHSYNFSLKNIQWANELRHKVIFKYYYNLSKNGNLPKSLTEKKYFLKLNEKYVKLTINNGATNGKEKYNLKDIILMVSSNNLWNDICIEHENTGEELTKKDIVMMGDIKNILDWDEYKQ